MLALTGIVEASKLRLPSHAYLLMFTKSTLVGDYVLMTLLALMFGSSFLFTHVAVQDMPPLTIATARLALAFLVLYPLMRILRQSLPRDPLLWRYIIAAAFFGNALPFSLISWGQVRVDAGLTAILMAVMPLMTLLLAHVFTQDEKLNRLKLAGVLLGLLGVVVLMGWDKLGELGDEMVRQYAIVAAALCYAVNALLTKKLTRAPRLSMMTSLMLAATLMLLPVCLWLEQPWMTAPDLQVSLSVIFLALGPTALATLMILVIIDRQGASFLSQINFMVPVFGVAMAWLLLAERLPVNAWLALIIILAGILLSRLGNRPTTT